MNKTSTRTRAGRMPERALALVYGESEKRSGRTLARAVVIVV